MCSYSKRERKLFQLISLLTFKRSLNQQEITRFSKETLYNALKRYSNKGNHTCGNYSHPIHRSSISKALLCLQETPPSPLGTPVPAQKHQAARGALRGRSEIAPITTALLSQTDSAGKNEFCPTLAHTNPSLNQLPFPSHPVHLSAMGRSVS